MADVKPRLVRADDFIAESLEKRASQMPQGSDADDCRRMAQIFRNSNRTGMVRVWEEASDATDYRIGQDGTSIALLSDRATQRGTGPKPPIGSRLVFKTRHDTADSVRVGEAEGFTFDGKEHLIGA